VTEDAKLLAEVNELTRQVSWVRDYHRCWLMMRANSEAAERLLEETDKSDVASVTFLKSVQKLCATKCSELEQWLKMAENLQNRRMQEVDPDVAINR